MAEAGFVGPFLARPGLVEIGLDFGGEAGQRHAYVAGNGWRHGAALAKPKTAYLRRSMLPPDYPAELVHSIEIAGFG
jgi:hypothetical protein